jgi:hypothetical protein
MQGSTAADLLNAGSGGTIESNPRVAAVLARHEVGGENEKAAETSQEPRRFVESLSTAWRASAVLYEPETLPSAL